MKLALTLGNSYSPRSWLLFAHQLHGSGLIYHHWPTGSLEITQAGIDYLDQVKTAKIVQGICIARELRSRKEQSAKQLSGRVSRGRGYSLTNLLMKKRAL
jgi:hypothetical protein